MGGIFTETLVLFEMEEVNVKKRLNPRATPVNVLNCRYKG